MNLKNETLDELENFGFLEKNLLSEIKKDYLPWLYKNVFINIEFTLQNEVQNNEFLIETVNDLVKIHHQSFEIEKNRRRQIEEDKIRMLKVFLLLKK